MVVKRMLARIGCMLFAVLVLLNLAVTAYAQVNSGSLTLKAVSQTNGKRLSGLRFYAYRVAEYANGSYRMLQAYEASGVDLNLETAALQKAAAETLDRYIAARQISETVSGLTGTTGELVFPNLELGVYLVCTGSTADDGVLVESTSFLVMIPMTSSDGTELIYEITAEPKLTTDKPVEPPVDPPDNPDLPQTGQENATAIYVLAGLGAMIIISGFLSPLIARKRRQG